MPPKKDVKCYERTNKKGQRYTTCKDKKTGEQLRKTTKTTKSTPAKKPSPPKAKSPPKSEIEKRTGKTRAEINKMKPSDVVKALPLELREKIASKMSDGYKDTGIKLKNTRANLYKIKEADGSKPELLHLYMKKGKVNLYRVGKKPTAFGGNPTDLVLFNESGRFLFEDRGDIRTGTYDNGTKKGKEVVYKDDAENRQEAYKYSKDYNREKWNNKTKRNRAGTILTFYTDKGKSMKFFKKQ